MSSGFYREADARIVLRVEEVERLLLVSMAEQVLEIVAPRKADPDADPLFALVGIDPSTERPTSEVLLRLFPDAYGDDEEASSEFRRFTERDLRQMKTAHANSVLETLQRSGDKVMLTYAIVMIRDCRCSACMTGSRIYKSHLFKSCCRRITPCCGFHRNSLIK